MCDKHKYSPKMYSHHSESPHPARRVQTVHGGDDGAGLAAQLNAHVRGDVNETLRHVIEANLGNLQNTRGRNIVTLVVMREGYGGV